MSTKKKSTFVRIFGHFRIFLSPQKNEEGSCRAMQATKKTAVCVLGNSDKVSGTVRFTQENEGGPTHVKVSIKGLAPGRCLPEIAQFALRLCIFESRLLCGRMNNASFKIEERREIRCALFLRPNNNWFSLLLYL